MFFKSIEEYNELASRAVEERNFNLCDLLNDIHEYISKKSANCYCVPYNGRFYIYIPKHSRCLFKTRRKADIFANLIKTNMPSNELSLKPYLNVYLFKHMRKAYLSHVLETSNGCSYWHIKYNDLYYRDIKAPVKSNVVYIFPDYESDK